MARSYQRVLRNQGRGIAGGLLVVGIAFLYTMETWWLGWRLPVVHLVVYAFVGLAIVMLITRSIGFRAEDEEGTLTDPLALAANFAELTLQSFVAAYTVLLLFGIVEWGDSLITVVRLGLLQVVPFGFGAAVANELLGEAEDHEREAQFPDNLSTFAFGAVFVTFPMAPTGEMEVIAVHAGWVRLPFVVVLSVAVIHFVLHELAFRGTTSRVADRSNLAQLGTSFTVYSVAVLVSTALLAGFGHFAGTTVAEWVQQIIVLSFPASVGGSAGEVVF